MMWDIVVNLLALIPLLLISVVLLRGKGGFLIAGFNMLTKDIKENVQWVKLCKFMGKITLGLSCSAAFLLGYAVTGIEPIRILGLVILAFSVVIALIWSAVRYMIPAANKRKG